MKITISMEHVLAMVRSLLLLPGAANADEATYGRAGGPVGADAIAQVVRDSRPAGTNDGRDFPVIYGQAGQPVGADAIEYVVKHARRSMATERQTHAHFGRAGGAIGIDRTWDDAAPRIAQMKR